jgi:hypothetical protein
MRTLVFNSRLLDVVGYATLDGSKRFGKATGWRRGLAWAKRATAQRVDEVQGLLFEAVNGCPNDYMLVRRILCGEVTQAQVANCLGRSRSSVMMRLRGIIAAVHAGLIAIAAKDALDADCSGCTINPRTCERVESDFWAVSLIGFEKRYRKPPTSAQLKRYLLRHWSELHQSDNKYLGIGFDEQIRRWCVDITILVNDRFQADAIARANRQRWIFNLNTRECVAICTPQSESMQQAG